MIHTQTEKQIRVMLTTFRDGLQSAFGGKVRLNDFLPAMKASAELGVRHFEFGGGARYQAPYFYLGENPFEDMRQMRAAVGPDVDLQILTRSVSGVTLTTQSIEGLRLQAQLMRASGTTWDRNFDFMNDVRNLISTGRPIVDAGMHHQVCIALMGLPFHSETVHTAEFYIDIGRRMLDSDVRVDSICLKDASGTTDPRTIYDAAVGLKKIMPPEMPLWMHTHDTASTAVACYMAAIAGGADGVDLSVRPMASGTVQPDARSLAHALKGTGYTLDIDVEKLPTIENMLNELMADYNFNPTTTTADARVLGFPMPGGAIGPNVHMMVKAGILDKYSDVLAEFPVVVEAGGAWTSVTPGSQQYWLQAFNNVLHGRWKKTGGHPSRVGATRPARVRRRPARSGPQEHWGCSRSIEGTQRGRDRREHVPRACGHGPGQEAGGERGDPATHRQCEDRRTAQAQGRRKAGGTSVRAAGRGGPGHHRSGDNALHRGGERITAHVHDHPGARKWCCGESRRGGGCDCTGGRAGDGRRRGYASVLDVCRTGGRGGHNGECR
jgi:pyruvate/oxaloacetate carboxyltransferase